MNKQILTLIPRIEKATKKPVLFIASSSDREITLFDGEHNQVDRAYFAAGTRPLRDDALAAKLIQRYIALPHGASCEYVIRQRLPKFKGF